MDTLRVVKTLGLAVGLAFASSTWASNDVTGEIEAIDAEAQTITVQGIEFQTDERTDYDDGLKRFEDLAVGQRVEVDFEYRDGRHIATEIEREK